MPVPNSSNRSDPGQRVSHKTVPLCVTGFLMEENELVFEEVWSRTQMFYIQVSPPIYRSNQAVLMLIVTKPLPYFENFL